MKAFEYQTAEQEQAFTLEIRGEFRLAVSDHARFLSLYSGRGPLRLLIEHGQIDAEALQRLGITITEVGE